MKWRLLAAALLLATAAMSADTHEASAANAPALVAAKRALQAGFDDGSAPAIKKARAQFEMLSQLEPKSAALHYWVALANWRLAPFVEANDAVTALQATLDECDAAIKLDDSLMDAVALLAMTEGQITRYKPALRMTYGLKSMTDMNRARTAAPDNPRVQMICGVVTLHMPAFVGGGADKALPLLQKSRELFEAHAVEDSLGIDWGHDDILVWLGQAASENNEHDKAIAYYEAALKMNPECGWAKGLLRKERHPEAKAKS